jgi:uracil-DNA glycosylase family 4
VSPRGQEVSCASCPLKGSVQVPPTIVRHPELIICGEAPGANEVIQGKPFIGDSGDLLDGALEHFGIPRARLHITNAMLCRPRFAGDIDKALAACQPRLERELKASSCNTVLALGGWALKTLTNHRGIFDWAGAPLSGLANKTVLPTIHPAYVLRPEGRLSAPLLYTHIGRAWELAHGRLPLWKWPKILIEPTEEALEALRSLRGQHIGFDTETRGKDPRTSLAMAVGFAGENIAISLPCERYVAKHGEVVQGLDELGKLGRALRAECKLLLEDEGTPKVLQNGQYDIFVAERQGWAVYGYSFDTLLASAVALPGGRHDLSVMACLEFWGPRWKSEFHVTADAKGLDAFVKRAPEELRLYNAKDAWMTLALERPLSLRLEETHHGVELHAAYLNAASIALEMKRRGVKVDVSKFARHRKRIQKARAKMARELLRIALRFGYRSAPRSDTWRRISRRLRREQWRKKQLETCIQAGAINGKGEALKATLRTTRRRLAHIRTEKKRFLKRFRLPVFNPNSKAHLDDLFFKHLRAIPTTFSKKTHRASLNEELLSRLLVHPNPILARAARALLFYRRAAKLLSTFIDGLPLDEGHVVHPTWNVYGARTMRWSAQDPNVMNIPRPVIKRRKSGEEYVARRGLRDLFVGHNGNTVVEGDYKQIELRVIAQLAGDEILIEGYQHGADMHELNARGIFGIAPSAAVTKTQRDLAKTFVYACVPMDTQALTRDGWKTYGELRIGEEILTFNPKTHKKEWAPIDHLTHLHKRKVYEMGLSHRNFRVRSTADHRWFCYQRRRSQSGRSFHRPYQQRMILQTAEINSESSILVNAPMKPDKQSTSIPRRGKWRVDWTKVVCRMSSEQRRAFLAGFLVADGWWQNDTRAWMWNQNVNNLSEAALTASFIEHDGVIWTRTYKGCGGKKMIAARLSKKPHVTGQKFQRRYVGVMDVWCPTTHNGSWVMRQGDVITITGNCNYGGEDETIWKKIYPDFPNVTILQIARMRLAWFRIHHWITTWHQSILREARQNDYLEAPLSGHRQPLFRLSDQERLDDNFIYNWPVQHTAADIINRAIPKVAARLDWPREGIMFQYHDALILDGPDPDRLAKILREEMTCEIELNGSRLLYDIDVKVGPSWGEATKLKV